MNQQANQILPRIIDALESLWLENVAMAELLDHYEAPNWFGSMQEYCQRENNKDLARARFAPFRALIESAQSDSKVLESFLRDLQSKGNPN